MEAHAVYFEPFVKSEYESWFGRRPQRATGLGEGEAFCPSSLLMFAFLIKDETMIFISIDGVKSSFHLLAQSDNFIFERKYQ
jgi:hypothetical protein